MKKIDDYMGWLLEDSKLIYLIWNSIIYSHKSAKSSIRYLHKAAPNEN